MRLIVNMDKETLEGLALFSEMKNKIRNEISIAKEQKEYWDIYVEVLQDIQHKLGLND